MDISTGLSSNRRMHIDTLMRHMLQQKAKFSSRCDGVRGGDTFGLGAKSNVELFLDIASSGDEASPRPFRCNRLNSSDFQDSMSCSIEGSQECLPLSNTAGLWALEEGGMPKSASMGPDTWRSEDSPSFLAPSGLFQCLPRLTVHPCQVLF